MKGGVPRQQLPIPNAFRGDLLARRQAHRLQPALRRLHAVEALPRRHASRRSGSTTPATTRSRRCRSRRTGRTTSTRCGSATRSTSARTATASSTSSRTTRRRRRSSSSPTTRTSRSLRRRPAAGRSSTSRPATCTSSTRRTGRRAKLTIGVAADLRETRPRFVKGARYIRDGVALAVRRARGRSSSAARSSPCRPRRATRAT